MLVCDGREREKRSTDNDECADNLLGRVVLSHYHAIDEVACQADQDNKERDLKNASAEESGADGRGSVARNLHLDVLGSEGI